MEGVVVLMSTSVLVTLSNAAIILMVVFIKKLRTSTNYFVLSLAISDMLTGAVVLPLNIMSYLPTFTPFLNFFILTSGVLNACALTWDRYLAVMNPFQYKNKIEMQYKKILVAIWSTSVLFTLIPLAWEGDVTLAINRYYSILVLITFIVLPYVLISVAYLRILLRLRSHAAELARISSTREVRERATRASLEGKTVKLFLVVVSIFLLSWVPVIYITVVIDFVRKPRLAPRVLHLVSLFTIACSSLASPIIYAIMKKDFNAMLKSKIASFQNCVYGREARLTTDGVSN